MQSREVATEFTNGLTFVGLAIIPNDDHWAAQMTKQMSQELAHFGLLDVLAVKPAIQSETSTRRTDRHRGNGGDLVVLEAVVNEGRLPAGSPRTPDRWNQEVAGFVNQSDMGTQPRRVFLCAANPAASRLQWPPHSAAWRAARVFGRSTSKREGVGPHGRDGSERRTGDE